MIPPKTRQCVSLQWNLNPARADFDEEGLHTVPAIIMLLSGRASLWTSLFLVVFHCIAYMKNAFFGRKKISPFPTTTKKKKLIMLLLCDNGGSKSRLQLRKGGERTDLLEGIWKLNLLNFRALHPSLPICSHVWPGVLESLSLWAQFKSWIKSSFEWEWLQFAYFSFKETHKKWARNFVAQLHPQKIKYNCFREEICGEIILWG